MSNHEIFSKVQSIVARQLENEIEKVTLNASFIKDLGADYLDVLEILIKLEEAFDTEFSELDSQKISTIEQVTIEQIVNCISQKVLV
jgi:acyl carrier protein